MEEKKGIYADILINLGYTLNKYRENRNSMREINEIVRSSKNILSDARNNRGNACYGKNASDADKVDEIYRRAIRLRPSSGTSNGGISERHSSVFIPTDDPECQIFKKNEFTKDRPDVKVVIQSSGYVHIEPVEKVDKKTHHGWTSGGAYIKAPSKSGMGGKERECFLKMTNGKELVSLHDRKDTWEMYDILSR